MSDIFTRYEFSTVLFLMTNSVCHFEMLLLNQLLSCYQGDCFAIQKCIQNPLKHLRWIPLLKLFLTHNFVELFPIDAT